MLSEEDIMSKEINNTKISEELINQISNVYIKHTSSYFKGLILHGSAHKGGAIAKSSDIDFRLYLDDEIFNNNGTLPLEMYLKINEDLSLINIKPFSYIQCDAIPISKLQDDIGLVQGSYRLISGNIPIKEASNLELKNEAENQLSNLETVPGCFSSLLDCGGDRIERLIRLLSTQVWPILFHTATLENGDGNFIWKLPKNEMFKYLPNQIINLAETFFTMLYDYHNNEDTKINVYDLSHLGYMIFSSAKDWYDKEYNKQ